MPQNRFEPLFPAHAIERCAASVIFDQLLPHKVFTTVSAGVKAAMASQGMVEEATKMMGINFDVATGQFLPIADGPNPIAFVTPDKGTKIILFPNQVTLETTRYIRWKNFRTAIEKLMLPILAEVMKTVSISAVQTDYTDRFLWTGSWADFETKSLLRPDSELITRKGMQAREQWHSHTGWFEYPTPGRRKLFSANVDVATAALRPGVQPKPSVGITTTVVDFSIVVPPSVSVAGIPEAEVILVLDSQHVELKQMLKSILSDEMAKRIEL